MFKKEAVDEEKEYIINQLEKIKEKIKGAKMSFEFAEDDNLIESLIYEIMSLESKYRYFIKLAKEKEISSDKYIVRRL